MPRCRRREEIICFRHRMRAEARGPALRGRQLMRRCQEKAFSFQPVLHKHGHGWWGGPQEPGGCGGVCATALTNDSDCDAAATKPRKTANQSQTAEHEETISQGTTKTHKIIKGRKTKTAQKPPSHPVPCSCVSGFEPKGSFIISLWFFSSDSWARHTGGYNVSEVTGDVLPAVNSKTTTLLCLPPLARCVLLARWQLGKAARIRLQEMIVLFHQHNWWMHSLCLWL